MKGHTLGIQNNISLKSYKYSPNNKKFQKLFFITEILYRNNHTHLVIYLVKLGLKGGISNTADYDPLGYVLSCCGRRDQVFHTFF